MPQGRSGSCISSSISSSLSIIVEEIENVNITAKSLQVPQTLGFYRVWETQKGQILDSPILKVYTNGVIKLFLRAVFFPSEEYDSQGERRKKEEPQEIQEQQMKQNEQTQMNGEASAEAQRIAELETQLAQAQQEAAENWNKYVRERAEMDNFRKRQERLSADRVAREKKTLILKILDVMDNVDRALVYQETMDKQALQHTLRMLIWQLNEVMRVEGLTPVTSLGEVFNPYVHEAVEAVENSGQPEGTIVEEVLKGYKMGDETLRPARVKVSSGDQG